METTQNTEAMERHINSKKVDAVIEAPVSYFISMRDTDPAKDCDIVKLLNGIKNGDWKDPVLALRRETDKDKRTKLKGTLRAYTPSGRFSARKIEALIAHSGIICLDFDDIDVSIRSQFEADPMVFACHLSCGGKGLAVYVRILGQQHRDAFNSLEAYFLSKYKAQVDIACKDVSRLRFVSYDPDLYLNLDAYRFELRRFLKADIEDAVKAVENSGVDLTTTYADWWRLALAFASECSEEGREYFHRISRANPKYNYEDCDKKYSEALKNGKGAVSIGSFYYSANQAGVRTQQTRRNDIEMVARTARRNGQAPEEAIALLKNSKHIHNNSVHPDLMAELVQTIYLEQDEVIEAFWYIAGKNDDKGKEKLVFSEDKFYREWLPGEGFFRYRPIGTDEFSYVRVVDKVVQYVSEGDIISHVRHYIANLPFEFDGFFRFELNELVIKQTKSIFNHSKFLWLPDLADRFVKDTRQAAYFYFKNGFVCITAQTVIPELQPLAKLPGFVWQSHIIDRNYAPSNVMNAELGLDIGKCDFGQFLYLLSDSNADRCNSLVSMIGYMLHRFKDSTRTVAPILCDEEINENPVGGTGKSLIMEAIGKMRSVLFIDGKNFRWDKSFGFARYQDDMSILALDDVPEWFDFKRLFVILTKGLVVEKKGKDEFMIPFEHSPKVIITTNYVVLGDTASFNRRKWDIEIAPRYDESYRPVDDFGTVFFDEWDEKQWNAFDELMMGCCRAYLISGILKRDSGNLKEKYLLQSTSRDFVAFMDALLKEYPSDHRHGRESLYEDYISESGDDRKKVTKNKFKKWLEKYCETRNVIMYDHEDRLDPVRWAHIFKPNVSNTLPTPFQDLKAT